MDGLELDVEMPLETEGGGLLSDIGGEERAEPAEGGEEPLEAAEGGEEPAEPEEGGDKGDTAAQTAARSDKTRAEVVRFLREGRTNEQLKPVYDAISKAWYRDQEYSALGDLKDLRGLKEQVDILGGPEAIGRLRDLEVSVESIDKMVDAGDPQVIEDMFSESPEGMKKLIPAGLDKLRSVDPQAYAAALTPHLVQAVTASGLGEWIASARELIDAAYSAKDPEHARFYMEKAFRQVSGVQGWLDGLGKPSAGPGSGPGPGAAPAMAAPGAERGTSGASAPSAAPDVNVEVQQQLVPWAKTEIERALKPLMGSSKLDAAKLNDIVSLTAAEIDRRLSSDETFTGNLKAWQRTGKAESILKQAQAGIRGVLAASARAVWERHGTATKPGTARTAAPRTAPPAPQPQNSARGQTQNRTAILVSRKPADKDFAPGQDMIDVLIRQSGTLKDGRVVRWK